LLFFFCFCGRRTTGGLVQGTAETRRGRGLHWRSAAVSGDGGLVARGSGTASGSCGYVRKQIGGEDGHNVFMLCVRERERKYWPDRLPRSVGNRFFEARDWKRQAKDSK
jgi:hypothetical protein